MNTRADVEDLQITRTEKLLAVVLTAFLLVGGIWTYTRIDDVVRQHIRLPTQTLTQNSAIVREQAAQQRTFRAQSRSGTPAPCSAALLAGKFLPGLLLLRTTLTRSHAL